MMASSSAGNPYGHDPSHDDLLQDERDEMLDGEVEPDEPTFSSTSDRTPLTGNIQSQSSRTNNRSAPLNQNYLTSQIPGEDRRAPQNTLDESVWETVSRDLLAVWEKMKQVLWPKYLLGGLLQRSGNGIGDAESGGIQGFGRDLRGLVGRWPEVNVDGILQGGMSEGLRDWDLWGPLIFCLLLSMFLCLRVSAEQRDVVFSGVFTMVWVGEAVVTVQIKLLGGNISFMQSVSVIGYTIFPLVIASAFSAFGLPTIARIPVYIVLLLWSLAAGVSILGGSGVVKNRVTLAIYPLLLFYTGLVCLCFLS